MDFNNFFGRRGGSGSPSMGSFPSWYDYGRSAEEFPPSSSPYHPQHSRRRAPEPLRPTQYRRKAPEQPGRSATEPQAPQQNPKVRRIVVEDGAPKAPPPKPKRIDKKDAALKIQRVYRGYVIRRSKPMSHMKTIQSVRKELERFKSEAADPQRVKALRENMKERLRFSEGLMQLQERLDNIQNALSFVREARKSLNRELYWFQEEVDALLKGQTADVKDGEEASPENADNVELEEACSEDVKDEEAPPENVSNVKHEAAPSEDPDMDEEAPAEKDDDLIEESTEGGATEMIETPAQVDSQLMENVQPDVQVDDEDDQEMVVDGENTKATEGEEETEAVQTDEEDVVEKAVLVSEQPKLEAMDIDQSCPKKRERESVETLVRKLMDDNAQLKALVSECLKQKAVQNEVLLQLSKRVEKLEKRSKRNCNRKKDSVC